MRANESVPGGIMRANESVPGANESVPGGIPGGKEQAQGGQPLVQPKEIGFNCTLVLILIFRIKCRRENVQNNFVETCRAKLIDSNI